MGKKRKVSIVVTDRRFSKDQATPDDVDLKIQPVRRGSNLPLTHFSQILEYQEEDFPYKIQPQTDKVPLPPPPPSPHQQDEDPEPKKDSTIQDLETTSPNRGAERRWAYKNVLGISISFFFVFASFQSLQNLQSTINSSGGLGLVSLTLLYAFFTLAGFIAPSVLKILGTKYSLLIAFASHLLYTLANFYPSWYTLIPASVLLGAGSALMWAAGSSHLVQIAVMAAPKLSVDQNHLISTFTGIFFAIFQGSQIPGNLASSLILFPYDDGVNSTAQNDSYLDNNSSSTDMCAHTSAGQDFDLKLLYILVSVYTVFVLTGTLFLLTTVNHLGTENFMKSKNKLKVFLRDPLVELLGVMKDYKMVLIAPISIFNGLEQSFAFGTFSQAFIAQCFGTYQVGFTLIALGLSSAFTSVVVGKLAKYVPRLFIFLFGGVLNIVLLVFVLVWTLEPSYVFIFMFAVLWGAGDGVWNTMTASLTGILFPDLSCSAYSAQRIYLALGLTLGFVMAEVLAVEYRLWFMLSAVLVALTAVLIVELRTRKLRSSLCQVKAKPDTSDSNDTCDTGDSKSSEDGSVA